MGVRYDRSMLRLASLRRARAAAAALTCAWRLGAPAATAADVGADLAVDRTPDAAGCPDAAALAEGVNRQLGRRAVSSAPGARRGVSLRVRFLVDRQGYLAFVEAAGLRVGTRTLDDRGPSCEGLAEATAFTLALLLDDAGRPPAVDAPDTARPASSPGGRTLGDAAPRLEIGVGGALTSLLAGPLGTGLFAEAGVAPRPPFAIGVGGLWLPPRSFATVEPGRVDVSLLAGSLYACWAPLRAGRQFALGLCARPALGSLQTNASGYRQVNRDVRRWWAAAGASIDASGALAGPVSWTGRVGVFAPVRRDRFAVDEQVVYRSSTPTFFVGFGARATIW
jgi:hypothetical protein